VRGDRDMYGYGGRGGGVVMGVGCWMSLFSKRERERGGGKGMEMMHQMGVL